MFNFLKKKNTAENKDAKAEKPQASVVKKTKLKQEDINVMPDRFYITPNNNSGKRLKVIIIAVIAVALVGGLAVFFSVDWSARSQQKTEQPSPEQVQAEPEPIEEQPAEETEEPTTEVIEAEPEISGEVTPTGPSYEAEEVFQEEQNQDNNGDLKTGADSDGDGLTDLEEALYKSDPKKPDTDADGYLDGQEVKSGFNPDVAKILLEGTELVTRYENTSFKYSILYPTSWKLRAVDDVGAQILFQPEDSREFIEVIVVSGVPSLPRWYKEYVTPGASKEPSVASLNGWQVVTSDDGLTYYFGRRGYDKIYIVNYNFAGVKEINYQTTFGMMVNSFTFLGSES